MALTHDMTFRLNGITWQSGHVYTFRYGPWQHDPNPTLVLLHRTRGTHPNTGHQHRYITGINLSYIPRSHRRLFAMIWVQEYERTNGDTRLTWEMVKRRFPFLKYGIRRYQYKPSYYIQNPVEVPFDQLESAIVDTWSKDFSKKLKIDLMKKYRFAKKNISKHKKNPFGRFLNKIFRG